MVQSISNSINGVGYSGIGYVTSGVKLFQLKTAMANLLLQPPKCFIRQISFKRYLYVYVNKHPKKPFLAPLEANL